MIDATELAPDFWIGGCTAARDYRPRFDVIVNVASEAQQNRDHRFVLVNANGDYQFSLIDGPGNDMAEFDAAVAFVEKCLRAEKSDRVLVHCTDGMSRSLCVAARVYANMTGHDIEDVLAEFRALRGCEDVRPNCPHEALLELARRAAQ